nr:scytalone dehydratase-like protein mdpb [Quercus suber]
MMDSAWMAGFFPKLAQYFKEQGSSSDIVCGSEERNQERPKKQVKSKTAPYRVRCTEKRPQTVVEREMQRAEIALAVFTTTSFDFKVDYRSFLNKEWEAMPADEFVQMASSPHFLGNPLLRTQHLIGLGKWSKDSADEIVAVLQLRVAHQKYQDDSMKEVSAKGHDHGTGTVWFKCIDGEWKFAGVRPNSRWAEFDMALIFAS